MALCEYAQTIFLCCTQGCLDGIAIKTRPCYAGWSLDEQYLSSSINSLGVRIGCPAGTLLILVK